MSDMKEECDDMCGEPLVNSIDRLELLKVFNNASGYIYFLDDSEVVIVDPATYRRHIREFEDLAARFKVAGDQVADLTAEKMEASYQPALIDALEVALSAMKRSRDAQKGVNTKLKKRLAEADKWIAELEASITS